MKNSLKKLSIWQGKNLNEIQDNTISWVSEDLTYCYDYEKQVYYRQRGLFMLTVKNLKIGFVSRDHLTTVVDGVSFSLDKGSSLGIVGESGCGKSITALSIMRLLSSFGRILEGEILFKDRDFLKLTEKQMRSIRGNVISMIFQDPMSSLNPVFTIGDQIAEAVVSHHSDMSKQEVQNKIIETLNLVGISEPKRRMKQYPHQLSGGMRQRVMIAMALSCDPEILIADEPTTALDVTIQSQILKLIKELQNKLGMSLILITHDLGVVSKMCDEVAVMYAGQFVEYAKVSEIFDNPQHPYTKGLLDSIPSLKLSQKDQELKTIPGVVPSFEDLPAGCRFQDRCHFVQKTCLEKQPFLTAFQKRGHKAACFFPIGDLK